MEALGYRPGKSITFHNSKLKFPSGHMNYPKMHQAERQDMGANSCSITNTLTVAILWKSLNLTFCMSKEGTVTDYLYCCSSSGKKQRGAMGGKKSMF